MSQNCACCKNTIEYPSLRYPRMICSDCSNSNNILDSDNNIVSFGNIDFYGGFKSVHIINNNMIEREDHICFINNIKCYADEARFGGIVIQTLDE